MGLMVDRRTSERDRTFLRIRYRCSVRVRVHRRRDGGGAAGDGRANECVASATVTRTARTTSHELGGHLIERLDEPASPTRVICSGIRTARRHGCAPCRRRMASAAQLRAYVWRCGDAAASGSAA